MIYLVSDRSQIFKFLLKHKAAPAYNVTGLLRGLPPSKYLFYVNCYNVKTSV